MAKSLINGSNYQKLRTIKKLINGLPFKVVIDSIRFLNQRKGIQL